MKPKIFIGSSVEGLSVAYSIQQNLTRDADVTVWDQGVFELSKTTIESLLEILGKSDFGIFVFSQDDVSTIRKETNNIIRDNVLFEFGLFIGKLNRDRVFFVIPSNADLHLPTDLLGITPGKYDIGREDKSLQAATGPVCHQIRLQIKKLGIINSVQEPSEIPEKREAFEDKKEGWIDFFLKREYKKALDFLRKEKIDDNKPNDIIQNKLWCAYCELKMNEFKGVPLLESILKEYDSSIFAHERTALIFYWEDYIDKSIEILQKAIAKFQHEESLLLLLANCYKNEDGDEKALEFLLEKSPEKSIDITLEIVNMYRNQKDYESAKQIIHKTFMNYPNNELLRYNYSHVTSELSENTITLYLLDSLTRDFPENSTYWGYLSNCCLNLDLYDNALEACKKANELANEKEAWLVSNIGNILNNKGFYSEAIKYLTKSLETEKESEYAHNRLSSSLKLKQEEHEKVKSLVEDGRKALRKYLTNS